MKTKKWIAIHPTRTKEGQVIEPGQVAEWAMPPNGETETLLIKGVSHYVEALDIFRNGTTKIQDDSPMVLRKYQSWKRKIISEELNLIPLSRTAALSEEIETRVSGSYSGAMYATLRGTALVDGKKVTNLSMRAVQDGDVFKLKAETDLILVNGSQTIPAGWEGTVKVRIYSEPGRQFSGSAGHFARLYTFHCSSKNPMKLGVGAEKVYYQPNWRAQYSAIRVFYRTQSGEIIERRHIFTIDSPNEHKTWDESYKQRLIEPARREIFRALQMGYVPPPDYEFWTEIPEHFQMLW